MKKMHELVAEIEAARTRALQKWYPHASRIKGTSLVDHDFDIRDFVYGRRSVDSRDYRLLVHLRCRAGVDRRTCAAVAGVPTAVWWKYEVGHAYLPPFNWQLACSYLLRVLERKLRDDDSKFSADHTARAGA